MTRSPFQHAVGTCAVLFCLLVSEISCRGQEMEIHLTGGGAAMIPPAELLVTDSLGRRFGYDPSTGSMIREIPEMAYFREALDEVYDPKTGKGGPETITLYFGGPADGAYQLALTGVRRGEFTMLFYWYDLKRPHRDKEITGETFPGRTYRYRVDYVRDNAAMTAIVPDTYRFLGFSKPLGAKDPRTFRLGRTIPVGFRVRRRDGGIAADVTAWLSVRKDAGEVREGVSADSPATGRDKERTAFRYDRRSDRYVCDLGTRSLSAGKWRLLVILDDGSTHETAVVLRD